MQQLIFANPGCILRAAAAAALGFAVAAGAQAPAPPAPAPVPAPAAAAAPADAPVPKPWRVGPMDVSGFLDGYYSYNANDPTEAANGKTNDLYNFNDKTNQWNLSAAKLTLNHDPGKLGAHVDLLYGRTNKLVNTSSQLDFVEQAYISTKPPKAKGFELDLGKWVTSAGAEVIESKDNWNYSRSLLFAWAIPYYHFGVRTSMPVSKTETVGVQVVNGWNNITKSTGGVTVGLTSALVEPKYTWNVNIYTGPANTDAQHGYRNLFDTTILMTPNSKFNAYINYDFGMNKDSISNGVGDNVTNKWQGVAGAVHEQITPKIAAAERLEIFGDMNGYATGTTQTVKEFTATGEYHWPLGLLARAEYRHDWSDAQTFHKGSEGMVDSQSTFTVGLVAIFAPKR
jgi:hypothetical protein